MSAFTDILVQQTDPVTAIFLIVITFYVRQLRNDFRRADKHQRRRLRRLEDERFDDDTQS